MTMTESEPGVDPVETAEDTPTVTETGDGPRTGPWGRRTVLGALAAGVVTACSSPKNGEVESSQSVLPSTSTTSSTAGGSPSTIGSSTLQIEVQPVRTAAGATPEVALPVPSSGGGAAPAPSTQPNGSSGGTPSSGAGSTESGPTGSGSTGGGSTPSPDPGGKPPTLTVETTPTTSSDGTPAPTTGDTTTGTPTESTPADTAPADTAPTNSAPTNSAPTNSAPADTAPTNTTPTDTTPTTAGNGTPAETTTTTQGATGGGTPIENIIPPNADVDTMDLAVRRLTYGYRPNMRTAVANMGAGAFIEDQLSKSAPHPQTEAALAALPGFGDDVFNFRSQRNQPHEARLTQSSIFRAVNSDHQLFEVMAAFWGDHFSIDSRESVQHRNLARHYQEFIIRPNAMGKFRDLLQAVIHSPGMLNYLDNAESNANSPEGVNENLGREILELHSVGIDENDRQIYDLEDVQQASLALAGLSYTARNRDPGYYQYRFRADYAYNGVVSLFNGQWTSAGLSGEDVANSMIDFLANHAQTARYVSYKLCQRFVADAPPISLVESTAAVFRANDTDIVPALRHIFSSSEFLQSGGLKFRRPYEFVAAAIRALGVNAQANVNASDHIDLLETLEHRPWRWETPDGFPDEARHWLSAVTTQLRWNFAGNLSRGETDLGVNQANFRPSAATVDDLINGFAGQIGIGALPEADREAIATAAGATRTANANSVNNPGFAMIAGLMLSHPLFQVR